MKAYDGLLFDLDGTLRDASAPRLQGALPLYPGVLEGLKKLQRRYPLFLVSGCEEWDLRDFLKTSGTEPLFTDWECFGRTGEAKWLNLVAVCRRNRLTHSVYIGDSEADEAAAAKAGLPFFHVEYGHGSAVKPVMEFGHFDDVRDFFLSL